MRPHSRPPGGSSVLARSTVTAHESPVVRSQLGLRLCDQSSFCLGSCRSRRPADRVLLAEWTFHLSGNARRASERFRILSLHTSASNLAGPNTGEFPSPRPLHRVLFVEWTLRGEP